MSAEWERSIGAVPATNLHAYLLPRFGSWPLGKIDKAAVTAFDLELARKDLSVSTRNNIVIPLRTIIGNAVKLGHHERRGSSGARTAGSPGSTATSPPRRARARGRPCRRGGRPGSAPASR
uniref:Core-binding (CB) domain-containing protein n=1 Tax=Sorangium cellulosum TaxID=56 RepID=A0A3S5GYA2_SORCE|nr:hypothetical protein [Sorangium cellulosum]